MCMQNEQHLKMYFYLNINCLLCAPDCAVAAVVSRKILIIRVAILSSLNRIFDEPK